MVNLNNQVAFQSKNGLSRIHQYAYSALPYLIYGVFTAGHISKPFTSIFCVLLLIVFFMFYNQVWSVLPAVYKLGFALIFLGLVLGIAYHQHWLQLSSNARFFARMFLPGVVLLAYPRLNLRLLLWLTFVPLTIHAMFGLGQYFFGWYGVTVGSPPIGFAGLRLFFAELLLLGVLPLLILIFTPC